MTHPLDLLYFRVGATLDLLAPNTGLPSVMQARLWNTNRVPIHFGEQCWRHEAEWRGRRVGRGWRGHRGWLC